MMNATLKTTTQYLLLQLIPFVTVSRLSGIHPSLKSSIYGALPLQVLSQLPFSCNFLSPQFCGLPPFSFLRIAKQLITSIEPTMDRFPAEFPAVNVIKTFPTSTVGRVNYTPAAAEF